MKRLRTVVVGALIAFSSYGTLRGTMPDVATGTWSPVGRLGAIRDRAAAAALPSGDVLVSGGSDAGGPLATAEIFLRDGRFTPTAPMLEARAGHTAVTLLDGRVLVAGGRTLDGVTASAEVYAAGEWTPVGGMTDARSGHTATLLEDGRVLVAGGENETGALAGVEIFDPAANSFTFAGTMGAPRTRHSAARLADGRVLIAGGRNGDGVLDSIDVFEPASGTLSYLATLATPREDLSATTLMDGRVLLGGGSDGTQDLASTEIFDPATGAVASGTSMGTARRGHVALRMPDNNAVLLAGGVAAETALSSAELYSPWDGQVRATGAMQAGRSGAVAAALATVEGRLFVAGGDGLDTTEVYAYATVRTDKDDYAPGETVYVSGTGWQPNESVTFGLRELPSEHEARTFNITADEDGRISGAELFLVEPHHLGVRFYLTARGAASQAQMTFTDDTKLKNNAVTVLGAQTPNPVTPGSSAAYGASAAGSVSVDFTGKAKAGDIGCEVRLTAIGLPSGASATFSPATLTGTETASLFSLLTISTSSSLAPNTYTFTVRATGTGGAGNECGSADVETSASVTLVVGTAASASISGTIYMDANGNGSVDPGETGLGGVSVSRTGSGTTAVTTSASGAYSFTGLAAGSYTIDYTVPSGFANTGTKPRVVAVASGASSTGNDFLAAPLYEVTFGAVGLPTGAGSQTGSNNVLTLTIGSTTTTYTAGDLPVTQTVNSGTTVSYAYAENVGTADPGTRYHRTGVTGAASPVTVTAATTVTGEYGRQFKLTLATAPEAGIGGAGNPAASPAPGDGFYDEGSAVSVTALQNVDISAGASRWRFTSWTNATGAFDAGSVTLDAPKTVTANYTRQFLVTFAQSGIGGDTGTATVVSVQGTALAAGQLPSSEWIAEGTNVSYAYEGIVAATAGKRYVLTVPAAAPASPFPVAAAVTITATYKTQYEIVFAQSGIANDTGSYPVARVAGVDMPVATLPFAAWYDEGASVGYSFYSPISTQPATNRQYELSNAASLPTSPVAVAGPATITAAYSVNVYGIEYLRPIDQSTASGTVVNTGKNGRVIPVKVQIVKNGVPVVGTGTIIMRVAGANCGGGATADPLTEYADAGLANDGTSLFRWSPELPGFWIYNLDTRALNLVTNGCYRLDVFMNATSGSSAILLSNSTWALFRPVK